jgi:hypothetical protein
MAYGLKCFDANGYVTFDSTVMDTFLKVTSSGNVTVSAGSTSAAITANEVDYIYVWPGQVSSYSESAAEKYNITDKLTNSFKIQNPTSSSKTYYYIAFTR